MNRDEYRNRDESNTTHNENGCFYPIDKQSSGTWFGFNQHGNVLALLNRYQDKNIGAKTSRGIIIPKLLAHKNIHQINQTLNQMDMGNFNPFDLVVKTHNNTIQYSWDRQQLSHVKLPNKQPFLLSSTSVNAATILPFRQKLFHDYLAKYSNIKAKHVLSALHLVQDSNDTSSSIFMAREETHTKSISQVIIENNSLNFNYLTEKNLVNIDKIQPYLNTQNIHLKLVGVDSTE